ncbi:ABC transporter ATP-binding protein, partial [Streptomyces tricolor]
SPRGGPAHGPATPVFATCPSGFPLPPDAARTVVSAEETSPGRHRLAVLASHSDVLLRALLTARPPWHVVRVEPAGASPPDPGSRP